MLSFSCFSVNVEKLQDVNYVSYQKKRILKQSRVVYLEETSETKRNCDQRHNKSNAHIQ